MKVAIIDHQVETGGTLVNKVCNCFCGKYAPYKVRNVNEIKEGSHAGVFFIDEENTELVNKILNLIKNESRKNLG